MKRNPFGPTDTESRIRDILDSVVQAADTKAAKEIDYYNTRSSIDRGAMKDAQDAYHRTYDQAVKRLTKLAWTGGKFVEELHKGDS